MRLFITILFFTIVANMHAQKRIEGYIGDLGNKQIDVKWDKNNMNPSFVNYISESYLKELVDILNSQTNECGTIFHADSTNAPFVMLVTPNGSKSGSINIKTTYTIKDKNTGYIIAVISCAIPNNKSNNSDIKSKLFCFNGSNLGQFIFKKASSKDSEWYKTVQKISSVPVFNYRFDFSSMTIDGLDAKEYVAVNVYQDMSDIDKSYSMFCKKIEFAFVSGVNKNKKDKGYILDNKEDVRYEIVLKITDVTSKGGHKIEVSVMDKLTNQVLKEFALKEGDGKLNTFQTLLMEQLEKSAEEFGDKL